MKRPLPSEKAAGKKLSAFTLLELMIGVAIVGVLIAIVAMGASTLSERSGRARCVANLRVIGVATALYTGENRGWLPLSYEIRDEGGIRTGSWGDSKSKIGAWYWNLAPYVGLPQWPSNKVYLGEKGTQGLPGPVVFTCPKHGQTESYPITYPSYKPVSYAPTTQMKSGSPVTVIDGIEVDRVNLSLVVAPASKVWIIDATAPSIFNVSAFRWSEGGSAHEAFLRHSNGGNALFLDGHIEYIPLSRIVSGDIQINIYRLFDPYYN